MVAQKLILALVALIPLAGCTPSTPPELRTTYARVLGHYARDRKALTLMVALRKMTLLPARRVETVAPAMKKKGRVQVGADADLTLFDPATIIDRSTYTKGDTSSEGIVHVLVGGTFVVKNSQIIEGVMPGKAILGAR